MRQHYFVSIAQAVQKYKFPSTVTKSVQFAKSTKRTIIRREKTPERTNIQFGSGNYFSFPLCIRLFYLHSI